MVAAAEEEEEEGVQAAPAPAAEAGVVTAHPSTRVLSRPEAARLPPSPPAPPTVDDLWGVTVTRPMWVD